MSEKQNTNTVKMCHGQEEPLELSLVKSWCSANVDTKTGRANAKKSELSCGMWLKSQFASFSLQFNV